MKIPDWLVYLSVWISERTGGRPGYSLCARFYENRINHGGLWIGVIWVVDRLFWFDKQHCRMAWLLRVK